MKVILGIFLGSLSLCGYTQTAQMRINLCDGTTEIYQIDDIRKLTFSNIVTSSEDSKEIFSTIKSFNNLKSYPNPFSQTITIEYSVKKDTDVNIEIYNINGTLIKKINQKNLVVGTHKFVWNATDSDNKTVSPGTYICKIMTGSDLLTKKLIYLNQ